MLYTVEELLLLEVLTYLPDKPPIISILETREKTVRGYLAEIDAALIDNEPIYASLMTGKDMKNLLAALARAPSVLDARILETHMDTAYGGGGGISAVFLNEGTGEAVVAFRGTAENEWVDDFVGANKVDSLQQINALEWYKKVYERLGLERYTVTVIGHSKGGNKAKYITILNDTPSRCVSFDGQGFSDKFFEAYRDRILLRQGVIENHNVDFDYVNILMNDVGSKTFYVGFNYGKYGFAESHSPVTFFQFGEDGAFSMQVNPNGQRPEMQILDQFINSMIRSAVNDRERSETNELIGMLVERAFAMRGDDALSKYISFLCSLVGEPRYADNVAYLLAFSILYSRSRGELLTALKEIMSSFRADYIVKLVDLVNELVKSRRLTAMIDLSNFLILHVSPVVIRYIQGFVLKRCGVSLTRTQVRELLQIVSMTRSMMQTLTLNMDGSDLVVEAEPEEEKTDFILPDSLDIAVLAGGLSMERNLSLKTGCAVARALTEKGHRVILLDAFMGYSNREMPIDDPFQTPERYSMEPAEVSQELPDLWAVKKRREDQSGAYFGPNVLQICRQADVVFLALQGASGEDGKVQAALELFGINYTGCGYLSCAVSADKAFTKELLLRAGIPVPQGFLVAKGAPLPEPEPLGLRYPLIVKPNSGGIGVGISVAGDRAAYEKAVGEAFRWTEAVVVEEYAAGREFKVSVLNGTVLPVLEVLPLATEQAETGMSLGGELRQKCPADLPRETARKLQDAARDAAAALRIRAYAKLDFILRPDGSFVCLECDALPQLFPDSDLVLEAKAAGMSFSALCDQFLILALRKD